MTVKCPYCGHKFYNQEFLETHIQEMKKQGDPAHLGTQGEQVKEEKKTVVNTQENVSLKQTKTEEVSNKQETSNEDIDKNIENIKEEIKENEKKKEKEEKEEKQPIDNVKIISKISKFRIFNKMEAKGIYLEIATDSHHSDFLQYKIEAKFPDEWFNELKNDIENSINNTIVAWIKRHENDFRLQLEKEE